MNIGFTGTRHGMTSVQKEALRKCLEELTCGIGDCTGKGSAFMHGDCVGADAEAHRIVRRSFPGLSINIAPSKIDSLRAYCEGDVLMAPDDPLKRNEKIVDWASAIFACPAEFNEQSRGGTWFTIRFARKMAKPLTIVYPDGSYVRG